MPKFIRPSSESESDYIVIAARMRQNFALTHGTFIMKSGHQGLHWVNLTFRYMETLQKKRPIHHATSFEIYLLIHAYIHSFMYSLCVKSVNSIAGMRERSCGEKPDGMRADEAEFRPASENLPPPLMQLCSCQIRSDQHSPVTN